MRPKIAAETAILVALLCVGLTACKKTPFAREQAGAEAKNPRGLSIHIDTPGGRRQYRESEFIAVVTSYSSAVPHQYKVDIAEQSSVAVMTDMLHIDDRRDIRLKPGIACCASILVPLDREPYVVQPQTRFRLKPGDYEMYLTTRRVFRWNARADGHDWSALETASNPLKLRIVPDPGWEQRELAAIQRRLNMEPLACSQLSALDVPSATAEKLKNIENATPCGKQVKFQPSEFEFALPVIDKMMRSPDYGVTPATITHIAEMKIWQAHPEIQQVRNRRAVIGWNEGGWPLFIAEKRKLLQELCLLLPEKAPKARAITRQTMRELLATREFQGMTCSH